MIVKFDGKVWKAGNSRVITIPSHFIKAGMISDNDQFEIILSKKAKV